MVQKEKIILFIIIAFIFAAFYFKFSKKDFSLPSGKIGETKKEIIIIPENENFITDNILEEEKENSAEKNSNLEENLPFAELPSKKEITKEILVTDGVRHSVPLNEILSGGPPKDGIPSIDNPKFISVKEAEKFLKDEEPGIFINIKDSQRFYPFQILVWHEIVNDTINGKRILITYCPLCLSGIVFDPLVKGEQVEFGTSGKLWNSNLIMYDRKTDSLWSQILGEAIVGEMTGASLKILPSDLVKFRDFKNKYPNGLVLSKKTGAMRFYGSDPYGDYYTNPAIYFPVSKKDDRLEAKDFVLGIVINGKAKAYFVEAVKKVGKTNDIFEGKNFIVIYEKEMDSVRIYEEKSDGSLKRINPFSAFWFSWLAAHPNTELYK